MSTLFGGQQEQQQQQSSGGPTLSFQGIPLDRRPGRIPLGRGLFEIVKVGTRLTDTQMKQFYCVLKCVEHNDASNVGAVFEFNTMLQGMYVKASLTDIKKLLMFSFGAAVAKLDEKVVGSVLDKECLADDWKKFNETQAIEGRTVVGNRIRIFGAPGKLTKKDGTPKINPRTGQPRTAEDAYPRYYFDPADAPAA